MVRVHGRINCLSHQLGVQKKMSGWIVLPNLIQSYTLIDHCMEILPPWGQVSNMNFGGILPQTTTPWSSFFYFRKSKLWSLYTCDDLSENCPVGSWIWTESPCWRSCGSFRQGSFACKKPAPGGKALRVYSLTSLPVQSCFSYDSWNMISQPPVPVTMPAPPLTSSPLP